MKRVTGIGGIFFKAQDPPALRAWYQRHLGVDVQAWGGAIFPGADDGMTVWNVAAADDAKFAPGTAPFMINYVVDDLEALVAALQEEGCNVPEPMQASEHGKFAWVIDPEGNKVELWEAPGA